MKNFLFLLLLPVSMLAQPMANAQSGKPGTVTLTCKKFVNCHAFDSLTLFEPTGMAYKVISRAGRTADSSYVFTIPKGEAKFYAVGVGEQANAKIILGEESEVTMWGNCANFMYSRAGGAANSAYRNVNVRVQYFIKEGIDARNALVAARNERSPTRSSEASARLLKLDKDKRQFLDSLKRASPLLNRVAALYLTPEYEFSDKAKYASEAEFMGLEYFKNVNFDDPAYETLPDLADAFKAYASTVSTSPSMANDQAAWTETQLARLKPNSRAYRMAFSGLLAGFQANNSPNYVLFAKRFVKEFKGNEINGDVRRLEMDIARTSTFTPGMEAPDLVGETPDGGQYSLSQMRGKVVLIDFWASWCGPCIREMPNVKANYEKYASKGFDVLGVSLDRDKNAWLKSIENQGIPWKHISDLKGWQSEHAKLYSVSSIPQTLLLDREGKIIVRNLRGEQLAEKLRQIFGE